MWKKNWPHGERKNYSTRKRPTFCINTAAENVIFIYNCRKTTIVWQIFDETHFLRRITIVCKYNTIRILILNHHSIHHILKCEMKTRHTSSIQCLYFSVTGTDSNIADP